MEKNLDCKKIEKKWQELWEKLEIHRFDEDNPNRIYSIDSPPPFTSGDLHMGHVLSYAYFDFVARYKRLRGFNVYYPQGWDCQGFPTEVKVEEKYGKNMPREQFLKYCHEWTERYIERMRGQMKALGFSPDWRYEYKTMSPEYHKVVQYSLLKMYDMGLLYVAEHPVFWCPRCGSAIAKAETDEVERKTYLNYIIFTVDGENITIATTRPELLHACVAVFVHPQDERYKHLVGKQAKTPLGAVVPIKADADVDMEFGTGIVMVCTFGDKSDVVWAYRHKLPIIKAVDENGKLLNAGEFTGLTLDEARKKIMEHIKAKGLFVKRDEIGQVVKVHDRCKTPVEFIMSREWFAKLKGFEEDIKNAAKSMRWVPEFTIQYLYDWADYIEWDWVISRDRIFGTPLPFWYCGKCGIIPASYEELPVNPALQKKKCPKCGGETRGEEKVCDCWIDSSITPLIISSWPYDEKRFSKLYPSTLRPQGTEIIRTWAFYTIYRCLVLTGKPPFVELLLNGNVLAPDGKKMSKSLGNIIAPDELLEKYSADAIRQWAALSGALARDRPFIYKDIQFAQNFMNKLWNASRFIWSLTGDFKDGEEYEYNFADRWIISRCNRLVAECTEAYENFNFHAAITKMHEFFWHEFCDYYIESVKHRLYQPEVYGEKSRRGAQRALRETLEKFLKLLAPIAPHISEEIYDNIFGKEKSIFLSGWPEAGEIDEEAEKKAELFNKIISEVRNYKARNKMPLNNEVAHAEITVDGNIDEIKAEIKAVGRIREISVKSGEFKIEFH
ncbi:MAG: valine--tRNA ligase [Candidatus Micrarchaeia archaeon]